MAGPNGNLPANWRRNNPMFNKDKMIEAIEKGDVAYVKKMLDQGVDLAPVFNR